MDQLKTQLAVALKHRFWIGSVIVLLGSVYIWWSTTSQLAAETASQTSKVESAFRKVTEVRGEVPTTPNDHSHEKMDSLINDRTAQVLNSWKLLYDRQRKILTWPVQALKQDFVDEYIDLIPIERYVMYPTLEEDELETTLLSRYGTYIKNTLPGVASIADTEWIAEFEASHGGMMDGIGGGMSAFREPNMPDITGASGGPLVKWSAESQGQVLSDLFPWRGRTPNTLEVYYSQENIWILKQLLQIVADVNGDATQPYQAKIHEIKQFGIGKSVRFGAGQISSPGSGSMGMGMGMGMDMDMGMEMDMDMGMGDMGMGGDMGVQLDPADNRYVSVTMEPITGAALRSALESNSPSDASLAVAKRVPVMLAVSIHQKAVHELIATCGSSDLMVEVQQVRVLPQGSSPTMSGGGGMGGGMDMGMDMGMEDMGMEDMGMGGGMGMGGPTLTTGPAEEFPLDVYVEIYGIIYIYNPPDPVKFGLDDVTADTVIAGATKTIGGAPVAPKTQEGELPVPQPEAPGQGSAPSATPAEAPPADAPATAPTETPEDPAATTVEAPSSPS